MSGYVASDRIAGRAPRLAERGLGASFRAETAGPPAPTSWAVETIEGEAAEPAHDGRLSAVRERWSQLTFFLFDPNSWRT